MRESGLVQKFLSGSCLSLILVLSTPMPAAAGNGLTPATCANLASESTPGRRDTAIFDHLDGQVVWPNPAKLLVKDGDVFVIVFKETDATKFDYGISPLDTDAVAAGLSWKSGTDVVKSDAGGTVCLSWRFDNKFPLYKVTVSRRVPDATVAIAGRVKDSDFELQQHEAFAVAPSGQGEGVKRAGQKLKEIAQVLQAFSPPALDRDQVKQLGQRIDDAIALGGSSLDALEKIPEAQRGFSNVQQARDALGKAKQAGQQLQEISLKLDRDSRSTLGLAMGAAGQALLELSRSAQEGRRLSSYVFPIWVEAADAVVRFSSGFAFSGITSDKFFVRKGNTTNSDTSDDTDTVQRDRHARDSFRPDLMAYATIEMPPTTTHGQSWIRNSLSGRLGLSLGLGLGNDAQPRYFVGPSIDMGHQLLFTVGIFGGKVDALPAGQELGKEPINGANTLSQLGSKFKTGVGFGLSWTFGKDAEKNYLAALSGAQKVPEAAVAKPGKPTGLKIDDSCMLSWTKASDGGVADGYVIYEDGAAEAVGQSTSTTFDLKTTKAKGTNKGDRYQVAAKNTAGESERSEQVTAEKCPPPPPPAPPTAPGLPALDKKTCVLSWAASSTGSPTGYTVYLDGKVSGEAAQNVYRFSAVKKGQPIYVVAHGAGGMTPSPLTTAPEDCGTP